MHDESGRRRWGSGSVRAPAARAPDPVLPPKRARPRPRSSAVTLSLRWLAQRTARRRWPPVRPNRRRGLELPESWRTACRQPKQACSPHCTCAGTASAPAETDQSRSRLGSACHFHCGMMPSWGRAHQLAELRLAAERRCRLHAHQPESANPARARTRRRKRCGDRHARGRTLQDASRPPELRAMPASSSTHGAGASADVGSDGCAVCTRGCEEYAGDSTGRPATSSGNCANAFSNPSRVASEENRDLPRAFTLNGKATIWRRPNATLNGPLRYRTAGAVLRLSTRAYRAQR